jgi:hypothetical protein
VSANWSDDLFAPKVEPQKRWVGGSFGYAVHRFPIKGGITMAKVLQESIYDIAPTKTPFLTALLKDGYVRKVKQ